MTLSIDDIRSEAPILDIIGIGFGPSNIAVAIAHGELAPDLSALFLESRPTFGWHDTMLYAKKGI